MSDISVPCRAPYEGFPIHEDDEEITINVGRDNDRKFFKVSVPQLCQGSEYFEERYVQVIRKARGTTFAMTALTKEVKEHVHSHAISIFREQ